MRFHARLALLATVAIALIAASAPAAAQAAGFGVEKFFAANCNETSENCGEGAKEPTLKESEEKGFTVAGGFVPFGVTDFVVANFELEGAKIPFESVKNLRTDVAPGVVTNPEAVPKCSMKDFEATVLEPAKGFHSKSTCPESTVIGVNKVLTVIESPEKSGKFVNVPLEGKVYNLEQPSGLASDFGVALNLAPLGVEAIFKQPVFAHTFIEGSVEWLSDYHDYFTIKNITPGLVESRLVFFGDEEGTTGFLRNPSRCVEPGPSTTTTISMESYGGAKAEKPYKALVGTKGCKEEPFEPSFKLTPETKVSDAADGITTELTMPHAGEVEEQDTADLQTAKITLPSGMTINPSGASGLEGCTPEQFGEATKSPDVTCPAGSRIGTVQLEVPTLPQESLKGPIYLGKPAGKSIEGPPYTIYLDAESARYGVKVRLTGTVEANPTTGQLTTTFSNLPEAPFDNAILAFKGGAFAPVANPLECTVATTGAGLTPYSGNPEGAFSSAFGVEGCASSPPPFTLAQSVAAEPAQGGGSSTFSFNLERPQGQQYLSQVRTTLAPGLLGTIPAATQCGEPQASKGECPASSQIGTSSVTAGSGSPFEFRGRVYLTGAYEGAPYGLSIVTPVVAGPFNLGNEVTRAKIEVNPFTAQVSVATTNLPTIKAGIPVRLRSLNVTINRQGFERNPTNCNPLAVVTAATSTLGAKAELSSPFQVEGCGSLAFKPKFTATTSAKTSKKNGASLVTTITQPAGQANIKLVKVTLPKQLPSRLTTLQKSCPQATFEANPFSCPAGSKVGTASVVTPVLPGKMTGPAYFVSHGGAAFPDLDLVLEDQGVRVILVGNTDIKKGITTTTFASNPDAPISSVTVSLPTASNSALGAFGDLCVRPLVMPTEVVAQNGKTFKQNTIIKVNSCGVRIVGHKVVGNTAYLTVKTFAPGRISGSGNGLSRVSRRLGKATTTSLKVPLSSRGRARRKPFSVRVRVGFVPSKKGPHSTATVTVRFR